MVARWKLITLSALGSGLEYYDFVIYVMLTPYISRVFFPANNHAAAVISALGIFAVGYVARPFGGMVFGHLGDRYGRKQSFTISILMMAFATLLIGLLPGYLMWGIASSSLLLVCRIIQGVAQGAEVPGAITFLSEHAPARRRGFWVGLLFSGVGIGAALAALISSLLTGYLSSYQMDNWGWRVPFLMGGVLAVIGWWMRSKTLETPLFMRVMHVEKTPLFRTLHYNWPEVMRGMGITLFPLAIIILALFFPEYLTAHFHYAYHLVFVSMTVSLFWSALLLPIMGYYSDWVGRKQLLMVSGGVALVLGYPLFWLLQLQTPWALWIFMFLYETLIAAMAACYPCLLAEAFPTVIRYTGVSLVYNIVLTLAAFIPMISSWILLQTGGHYSFLWLLAVLCSMMMVALASVVDTTGVDMHHN